MCISHFATFTSQLKFVHRNTVQSQQKIVTSQNVCLLISTNLHMLRAIVIRAVTWVWGHGTASVDQSGVAHTTETAVFGRLITSTHRFAVHLIVRLGHFLTNLHQGLQLLVGVGGLLLQGREVVGAVAGDGVGVGAVRAPGMVEGHGLVLQVQRVTSGSTDVSDTAPFDKKVDGLHRSLRVVEIVHLCLSRLQQSRHEADKLFSKLSDGKHVNN